MKNFRLLVQCAALLVPQFVSAADAPPPMNPRALAQVEAIYEYCSTVSPAMAKAKGMASPSISKASKNELDELRKSDEYKEAYDSTRSAIQELPKDRVAEACNSAVAKK